MGCLLRYKVSPISFDPLKNTSNFFPLPISENDFSVEQQQMARWAMLSLTFSPGLTNKQISLSFAYLSAGDQFNYELHCLARNFESQN
jgi:hypothetical protein